jgi:hypothetical protein
MILPILLLLKKTDHNAGFPLEPFALEQDDGAQLQPLVVAQRYKNLYYNNFQARHCVDVHERIQCGHLSIPQALGQKPLEHIG